jgi:acyl-coenzyme A synthetase/AMP-(fatty) acid ligase/acyl carrier protein
LANYLVWAAQAYGSGGELGAPVHSSLGFDLTVTSLLVPLTCGSAAVLVADDSGLDGLAAVARDVGGFDLAKLTPAHMRGLADLLTGAQMAAMAQRLVIGGEALTAAQVGLWLDQAPDTVIVNEYGPTETVVGCCVFEVRAGQDIADTAGAVPIGWPIANTRLLVLDQSLNPVPVGVAGELYIGGVGVARGYVGRPELTAERFVADALAGNGSRLYRSGDRVRRGPHGRLEFLGRVDTQVKVRGFRIEPGEVEAALAAHPGVSATAVVAHGQDMDRRLVAYLIPADPEVGLPPVQQLHHFLATRLPDYMIPAAFVELSELPLNRNGKVDRAALPAPDTARPDPAGIYTPPQTPTEELLAEIWTEVLGMDRIGIHDNFFTLGGHSLLATRLISRIRVVFDVEVPVSALFDTPTVADLAVVVKRAAVRLGEEDGDFEEFEL